MDLGITGKTALVTGASRGIGLAIAQALAAEGVKVVGAARTITPELEKAAAAVIATDLSTREGATTVAHQAIAEVGGIDFLVNNVGAGDPDKFSLAGFLDTGDEQWQAVFDLNLFSAVWTTRAALPSILERKGAIVNISSINARVPTGSPVGYAEAKAALTQFGKRLSEELAPRGVRVNTVSPGVTASPIWTDPNGFGGQVAAAFGINHGDLLAGLPGKFGMASGRLTQPEEVADLVAFLLSERAANIHGADYVIDGGTLKAA
ncbi:SDR family oxidoreductase [Kitasatospora acidiphila]|uniref:SDR family oxidoreductase n=1 Tax=Kitasatospora acidiphila TaxID=2567942 RepID=A0A540W067_9ACTN|nr:SDR family oxidoreductase [Kitasatospora acidiphila]TQF02381.1 SDR family oxidoreductase [Kitasatospora acidiphila]